MAARPVVELFYDVVSPYSWLAFSVICRYRRVWDIDLRLKPMFLGAVMKESGNRPPGMVPAKGAYMLSDLSRLSAYYNVPLSPPSDPAEVMFKKGTMKAQRLLTAAAVHSPHALEPLSHALWARIWSKDLDITENESLRAACASAQLDKAVTDKLLDAAGSDEVKATLTTVTKDAIERGAFGAPTFYVNGEMYFGCDRFPLIARQLKLRWLGPQPETKPETESSKL
eukprot:m.888312 g.888312  ORF g.888312 m.888312 type:complete len:226 (-) comp59928_c0_seq4:1349-2026(-)